ncbi:Carnosine N-Methyltransferase [Sphaerulina musiva]
MVHNLLYLSSIPTLLICIGIPLYISTINNSNSSKPSSGSSISWSHNTATNLLSSLFERAAVAISLPSSSPSSPSSKLLLPPGLAHSINSFEHYTHLASAIIHRKHTRYLQQNPAQRQLSQQVGYTAHFERARKGIEVNSRLLELMAKLARENYQTGFQSLQTEAGKEADLEDASMALYHLMRDWSAQGEKERQAVFPPVLEGLEKHFGGRRRRRRRSGEEKEEKEEEKKVLVPGSGTGRLASDIADLGFNVTANDMDYCSILAYHLLTNHTSALHEHTLQPFVTRWPHQANAFARYSSLTVPDHWPNKSVKLVEGDFLEMFPQDGEFDAVVTLFFIDMADNVIDFVSNIHRLLKPGGLWINLGPLKWGSYAELQLSAEEVVQLAELLGFDVDHSSRQSIDSVYAEPPDTLLKFTYVTQFWSAVKREPTTLKKL